MPTLLTSLLHPRRTLRAFAAAPAWPVATWSALTAIAVIGSCFYGASLARVLPWDPRGSALWLALSSGLGWCVLGPMLILATRQHPKVLAQACLVTMAYGEGVLALGAVANLILSLRHPGLVNAGVVAASNVVMALALASQLKSLGVALWKTLACWMLALNGSGALFFLLFRHLL
ncbi:MAG TPA: hypothetical protein VFF76_06605 [Holophagaceae bacterium]|jgi:hypothetical protein|nr:hypothetical protein [Holophagaceae bacterium]